jgi:hypothetical protein
MEKSMKDQSWMWNQATLPGFDNAISLQASADGHTRSASPDGPTTAQSGQDRLPVSPSPSPGRGLPETTSDTSRRTSSSLSAPADLLFSLESKSPARMCSDALQERLEAAMAARLSGLGSTMYRLTWKEHTTPSGRSISRLRGSAHRISGNGAFSGPTIYDLVPAVTTRRLNGVSTTSQDQVAPWQTPVVNDATGSQYSYSGGDKTKPFLKLPGEVQLTSWPTPNASNGSGGGQGKQFTNPDRSNELNDCVMLTGWPTATTRDHKDGPFCPNVPINGLLGRQVWLTGPARLTVSGEMLTGSDAQMSDGGQLNPEHSRWLMGFPAAWGSCGATAMQSCRRSRQSS